MFEGRIEKLKLLEMGPFREVELEFAHSSQQGEAEIHIFTGPNGCGKTTVLHALAQIFAAYNRIDQILPRLRLTEGGQNLPLTVVLGSTAEGPIFLEAGI